MKDKDNLILICTDEQTIDTLACYGNELIDMPNLNRLAGESAVYTRAYCTQPVCTPARGSFLSGLYPHQHGAWQNNLAIGSEVLTLGEYASAQGYATGYIGKWHLGDEVFSQHGFETWESIEDEYIPWYSTSRDRAARSSYYQHLKRKGYVEDPEGIFTRARCARLSEDDGKPAFVAERSIEFIAEHKDEPFVLVSSFLEPHMPFFGPRDEQYDPDSIPLPADHDAPLATRWQKALALGTHFNGESGIPLSRTEGFRRMRANYWGLCSLIDTHIGRILDYLRENGLDEKTHIIFTSDHGDMAGSHQMVAKMVSFEPSVRVPLLIRRAGDQGTRRIDEPVSQIDLLPTMLELLGIAIPEHLEGRSLFAREKDPHGFTDDIIIQWNEPERQFIDRKLYSPTGALHPYLCGLGTAEELEEVFRAPRRTLITPDGRYKLLLSADGDHFLFDLKEDPQERENRIEEEPELAGELIERLIRRLETLEDPSLPPIREGLRNRRF